MDTNKEAVVSTALDIYHTYDVSMEDAMEMALNEAQSDYQGYDDSDAVKESVVNNALDIYHTYDVSMEEAMDIALEGITDTLAAAGAAAKDVGATVGNNVLSGVAGAYSRPNGTTNLNIYSRTPGNANNFHDLVPGPQRAIMQGILKWIDDYNLLEDGPAKKGIATKISKAINDPIIRNLMMKSGYWEQVPPEVRAMQLQKHAIKYDKMGYKADKKDERVAYKREKVAAKAAAKAAKRAAKRAAKEAAFATADEYMQNYDISTEEALDLALEELGYSYDDINDDYDSTSED